MTTSRRSRGRKSTLKTAAASVLGVAVYSLFSEESYLHNGRRYLTSELEHEMEMTAAVPAAPISMPAPTAVADETESVDFTYLISSHSTLLPWAQNNLVDVHEGPVQSPDATNMFWHIPKVSLWLY